MTAHPNTPTPHLLMGVPMPERDAVVFRVIAGFFGALAFVLPSVIVAAVLQ